jgi:APA family basic amino acid/polyamine antiporter
LRAALVCFRLRIKKRDAQRPYRAFGYPWLPSLYILGAAAILLALFAYRASTTWPDLLIVITGIPVYYLLRRSAEECRTPDKESP